MKKNRTKRVAIYLRKSVLTDKGDSIKMQLDKCKQYCEYYYSDFTTINYIDEGFSGATSKRPNFNKLNNDIKNNLIDVVMCYKIDRISRNIRDFSVFYNLLEEKDVKFVSVTENIDTSSPIGRAMMYISSIFSQMERETITERITDNMLKIAKDGKWAGGQPPFGLKRIKINENNKKHTELRIDEERINEYFKIVDLFLGGKTLSSLEGWCKKNGYKTLKGNLHTTSTLHTILKNPHYAIADASTYQYFKNLGCQIVVDKDKFNGKNAIIVYGRTKGSRHNPHFVNEFADWKVSVAKWEGVIDGDKWISIQKKFGINKISRKKKLFVGILRGVFRCECGNLMTITRKRYNNKHTDWYVCQKKRQKGNIACNSKQIKVPLIDEPFLEELKNISINKELLNVDDNSEEILKEIELLKLKEMKSSKKIQSLVKAISLTDNNTAIKHFTNQIEILEKERLQILNSILELESQTTDFKNKKYKKDDLYNNILNLVKNIEKYDYTTVNNHLRNLIEKCTLVDGRLKVAFR